MPVISGKTRVIAVIGDPVSHSRSPAMHNAAFDALGLDYVYVAMRVAPKDLRRAIAGVRALGIWGLNVTVPHKEKIIPLLDRLTPRAKEIGAVNTVFRKGAELVGDNTDAEGFRLALRSFGVSVRGKGTVVLGAGGSARAVVWALVREGAASILVLNRTRPRARALVSFARTLRRVDASAGSLEDWSRMPTDAALAVNCTSIGLDGRSVPPIRFAGVPTSTAIYDLVYGERPTPLVREARRAGLRAADGREMLVQQAGIAFRSWTSRRAPRDVMGRAFEAHRSIR